MALCDEPTTRRLRHLGGVGVLVALLAGAVPGVGSAVGPEPGAGPLAALLKDLGSNDGQVREHATDLLMADQQITLTIIEQALRNETLDSEQRARLVQAAWDRFRNTPRAAMGVQFDLQMMQPPLLPDRLVISQTFPQFPSSRLLEPGDMVIEAAGLSIYGRGAQLLFGALIISRDPGDTLHVVVRRAGEKLSLDVPLGRFDDLPNTRMDEYRLSRAWRLRSQAYAAPEGAPRAPIDPGLTPRQWGLDVDPSNPAQQRVRMQTQMSPAQRGGVPIVAGGEPRGGVIDMNEIQQRAAGFGKPRMGVDLRAFQQAQFMQAWMDPPTTGPTKSPEEEIQALETRLAELDAMISRNPNAVPAPARPAGVIGQGDLAPPAERRMVLKELQAIQAEVAEAATHAPEPIKPPSH